MALCIANCLKMQHLNLPHRDHLLPQVVLVLANAAVPSSDRLVLADHDVLGNLVKQPEMPLLAFNSTARKNV